MAKPSAGVISAPTSIQLVDIGLIDSSPHNLPGRDKLNIDELAESIQSRGLMNPLTLAPKNGRYAVVAGHRRLAALKKLGITQAPATIRATESDQDHIVDILVENLQREDVTAMQEARTYKQLSDLNMKQREIGKQVGKSQPHVAKRLALADLPQEIQDAVDAGGIHVNDAYTLAVELKDNPEAMLRVFNNRSRGNINFLIAATKRAAESKASAAATGKPEPTEEDLTAQKDAAAKRRLITKLVKLADEARYKALQAVIKTRTAKTKLVDFTLQGLVEIVRFPAGGDAAFEATMHILAVNKVNDAAGFGQIWDIPQFIQRNAEENWIRLTHVLVLMRGHMALAGAKEPLKGQDQKFAAVTLKYLSDFVSYKTNQGEDYLLGLLEIGEVEPPVKEEKPKAEKKPRAKKGEAQAEGQAVETVALPMTVPEGRVQCPNCNGTGTDPDDSEKSCTVCEGSGTVAAE